MTTYSASTDKLTDAQIWAELRQELSCDICKGDATIKEDEEQGCYPGQCSCDGSVCVQPSETVSVSRPCPECDGTGLPVATVELAQAMRLLVEQLGSDRYEGENYLLARIAECIVNQRDEGASQARDILAAAMWLS